VQSAVHAELAHRSNGSNRNLHRRKTSRRRGVILSRCARVETHGRAAPCLEPGVGFYEPLGLGTAAAQLNPGRRSETEAACFRFSRCENGNKQVTWMGREKGAESITSPLLHARLVVAAGGATRPARRWVVAGNPGRRRVKSLLIPGPRLRRLASAGRGHGRHRHERM
jgi:hypothetical protein